MGYRNTLPVIIVRTAILIPTFILGCLCIVFTQWVSLILFRNSPSTTNSIIGTTKTHFVILLGLLTSIVNPCKIAVTVDVDSVPHSQQFKVDSSLNLHTFLDPNSVIISNHQIYTDWLFLWFLTYTSNLSNAVFIILKDLSKIPVLGYGMTNFNFLFLSRKWAKDKIVLTNQLLEIDANARGLGPANGVQLVSSKSTSADIDIKKWPTGKNPRKDQKLWPYELILFPEGTVPSDRTTKKSAEYVLSKGYPPLKHVLLPRVRGLFLALKKLRNSVEEVYDITTAYSDLKADEYGEIKFSLKNFYLRGYGPPVINYFIRAYKIKDIPLGDEDEDDIDETSDESLQKFEKWLLKIWYEKDELMNNFYETGEWNANAYDTRTVIGDFKLKNKWEIVRPYLPISTLGLFLYFTYRFVIVLIKSRLGSA